MPFLLSVVYENYCFCVRKKPETRVSGFDLFERYRLNERLIMDSLQLAFVSASSSSLTLSKQRIQPTR
jgi:hypothetical protein